MSLFLLFFCAYLFQLKNNCHCGKKDSIRRLRMQTKHESLCPRARGLEREITIGKNACARTGRIVIWCDTAIIQAVRWSCVVADRFPTPTNHCVALTLSRDLVNWDPAKPVKRLTFDKCWCTSRLSNAMYMYNIVYWLYLPPWHGLWSNWFKLVGFVNSTEF